MNWSERPVILLGNGARGADLRPLYALGVPILTSWAAKDMVDNDDPLYFGSPGQYGQRMANKVLYESDMIVSIGNRMSIWNVGYEGPRENQRVVMIDVDGHEVAKFAHAEWVKQDARQYLEALPDKRPMLDEWRAECRIWKMQYPLIGAAHADTPGYINSYRFMAALAEYLRPDEVIVTDMGTPLICAHQVLKLKPPQRLMTSGGLGEMGCGLPAAIGASCARDKGEVLCLHADGGMMMNLQELQTIVHHQLPIKIIVFSNEGYGMIRETQKKAGQGYVAVDKLSGVSMPSFRKIAYAFGIPACDLRTWDDFGKAIPTLFADKGPALIEYFMDPQQPMVPKLDPIYVDGKPTSPRFCDMSPAL